MTNKNVFVQIKINRFVDMIEITFKQIKCKRMENDTETCTIKYHNFAIIL